VPYRVTVSARFEAAHHLIHYRGQPEPLHGHSYRVEAVFHAESLDSDDLAADFLDLKKALEAVASELDYRNLNEHSAFRDRNTSAENLARFFAERIVPSLPAGPARLAEVTVWEGPENRATYIPE
jgi:6-pyruvoyltetrahydropterin/6-carboxytetrahydropterin synthase